MSDARVPLVRKRLTASGDLNASDASDSPEYDAPLAKAVQNFQQRMGLESDGVLGAGHDCRAERTTCGSHSTTSRESRSRSRTAPGSARCLRRREYRRFTIYFVRGQHIVWDARVQVGKPYRRTPIFRSDISYLVFNPTWTVPPGIIEKDILPAAKSDPDAITRKGLKVLDSNGRELNPHSIDWTRFKSGHIPYTLRQDPGPSNALGRVKLMFPNPYLVYLHDTPSQALFDRAERTFSSGCVRVERVLELTELVLDDRERWNQESIARVLDDGQTRNVTLRKKIPVLLAYWTAWVDPQGRTNFRRDIYGQDAQWAKALDADFKLRSKPLFSPSAENRAATAQQ